MLPLLASWTLMQKSLRRLPPAAMLPLGSSSMLMQRNSPLQPCFSASSTAVMRRNSSMQQCSLGSVLQGDAEELAGAAMLPMWPRCSPCGLVLHGNGKERILRRYGLESPRSSTLTSRMSMYRKALPSQRAETSTRGCRCTRKPDARGRPNQSSAQRPGLGIASTRCLSQRTLMVDQPPAARLNGHRCEAKQLLFQQQGCEGAPRMAPCKWQRTCDDRCPRSNGVSDAMISDLLAR